MGLQLIFVVETNKKCRSDWIYIKSALEKFYSCDQAHVKLSVVYMDGRGNYAKRENDAQKLIKQYQATSKNNESKVIYCFDCDQYDMNADDMEFLQTAQRFCKDKGYEYVWFCRDIESVFLEKKVSDKLKKREAETFKVRNRIQNIDAAKLSVSVYRINRSNLLTVLDKYIPPLMRNQL